jgi:hypothetical protein
MDALRPFHLPLIYLSRPFPTSTQLSCLPVGCWPVVLGVEEPANPSGRVCREVQAIGSCISSALVLYQSDIKWQHVDYVSQGHSAGEADLLALTDLGSKPGTTAHQLCDLGHAS